MNKNDSLKEYYIKLQSLYNNAVNLLTAINQSFQTSASEISVDVAGNDDSVISVRIPSFLYLENKLEQLDTNFNALFEMPESGEAWFSRSSDMFKLEMVKSNSAPVVPEFSTSSLFASLKQNNLLKDLVNPKTYIRLDISNLPDNVSQMYMKKIIFYSENVYNAVASKSISSYEEYKAALYTLSKGVDYDEYDFVLDLPVKKDIYKSRFEIVDIPQDLGYTNPYKDENDADSSGHVHLQYELRLDTISYTDQEDSSVTFTLKAGDYLCLAGKYAIYKVKKVTKTVDSITGYDNFSVIIEEVLGHTALQKTSENSEMILEIYNQDYSSYHYVEIPLEENPYIAVFIGTVQNNVRSLLSPAILLNLNNVYMKDENGNLMYETGSSTPMTYIEYYDKYCKNIGDLIEGITETAYPQVSNFSADTLNLLENSENIHSLVSQTIDNESILTVKRINAHLIDDVTSEKVISANKQKAELNKQLSSINDNIDQIYNQLTTTDFNQEIYITQESLKSQLEKYYTERTTIQKQLNNVIDNINILKTDAKGIGKAKYRVRGVTDISSLEDYIHESVSDKIEITGIDVEYKYKSVNSDTTNVMSVNNTLFTDWNRLSNIDRQRKLVFGKNNGFSIEFENYDSTVNKVKWNQVDIPISQGEDVVIRVRYKYNIGQPFIDLYTPWSDELTVTFPTEYEEDIEIYDIFAQNDEDSISAKFSKTLINDGYQEHIADKIVDNSQVYLHSAESIYSGFNTSENKLISLKDKLNLMTNEIENYKSLIDNELNSQYKVYLVWDNNSVELSNNAVNNITINEPNNNVNDTFIKKNMSIVVRNTGDISIKLYSIFPGNTDIPLLLDNNEFYDKYIRNYERVPIIIGDDNDPAENITYQTLGQWIYFRMNNPYTGESIYLDYADQDTHDINYFMNYSANKENGVSNEFIGNLSLYLNKNFNSPMLAYRKRDNIASSNVWGSLSVDGSTASVAFSYDDSSIPLGEITDYIYDDNGENKYLMLYEHFSTKGSNNSRKYLAENVSLTSFIKNGVNYVYDISGFNGAFLIPEFSARSEILCDNYDNNQYIQVDSGKSVTVPVTFEYFLGDQASNKSITKGLYFDLRPSVLRDPQHYMINITAKYDYTASNQDFISSGVSLSNGVSN